MSAGLVVDQWLVTAARYDELARLARLDGDTVAAAEYDDEATRYRAAVDELELGLEVQR